MDKLRIAATGFPGTTETFKFIVEAYEQIANALAQSSHPDDPVILAGVIESGGNVSDGYISYKGELYKFVGGPITSTVVIIEEIESVDYNTDMSNSGQLETHDTYFKRYAKCGNSGEGVAEFAYNSLRRLENLIDISELVKPATTTKRGTLEVATQTEVNNGTSGTLAVTPSTLHGRTATESRRGLIEIATQSEVDAGTDDSRAITPAKLAALNYGKVIASGTLSKSGSGTDGQDFIIIFNEYISLLGATTNLDNRYSVIVMVDSITSTDPGIEGHEINRLRATDKTSTQNPPVYGFYIKGEFEFLVPNTVSGSGTVTISYMVIEWP